MATILFVSHFEDLSNEIIYDIFDYLDIYHVHEAFHDLNIRFEKLVKCSNLPIHINTSFLSKSNFDRHLSEFVLPNLERIHSLRLSNSLMFKNIFSSSVNIERFIQLRTVILDNISSLDDLNRLQSLPNLSSLIINQSNCESFSNMVCHLILCLPNLKYCKLSLKSANVSFESQSNQSSDIEHLVISGEFNFNGLPYLLSCLPNLRRLSIDKLYNIYSFRKKLFSQMSNKLKHLSLRLIKVGFNQLESFLINYCRDIEVLRISTSDIDDEYMDANRWEELISSHLLNLRVFDIEHTFSFRHGNDRLQYEDRIRQFTTSFWIHRQWYFACRYPERIGRFEYGLFFSIKPYRRRCFVLHGKQSQYRAHSSDYHLVNQIQISNQSAIDDCSIFFPNVHDLTLSDGVYTINGTLSDALDRIIPLKQLNKIIINCHTFQFERLVEILYSTPNCYQLIIKSLSFNEANLSSIEHNSRFRSVSEMNQTTDLVIHSICTAREVKSLTKLCPHVQHLTIQVMQNEFASIMKYLLSKSNRYTHNLISLHIQSTEDIYIEKLVNLLAPLKRSNEFAIEDIGFKVSYIWW